MTQDEFDRALADVYETDVHNEANRKTLILIAKLLFEQTGKLEAMRSDIDRIEVSVGKMMVY